MAPMTGMDEQTVNWLVRIGSWFAAGIGFAVPLAWKGGRTAKQIESMQADIAAIKDAQYMTTPQHDQLQKICQIDRDRARAEALHDMLDKLKDRMDERDAALHSKLNQMCRELSEIHGNCVYQKEQRKI